MDKDWEELVGELGARFQTNEDVYRELARLQDGDHAFPEDLVARGQKIFATASARVAKKLCGDPNVRVLLNDSGPRTSEVLTIVPLIFNTLSTAANQDASIALIALLIVRMGVGSFCRRYAPKP